MFDYGLDARRPVLHDGAARRARTCASAARKLPLACARSAQLLRDVASALALLHSRRLLHRDVSPRNVRCTRDGRAKLIDFGTLVAMGPQTRIAGTPPFVPPEALHMQPLDARSDLYALGALAYYLLTGRNAYPARDIAELARGSGSAGRSGPTQLRPELPRALDDLVMALLSLDARGRPASAAEVIERLTAIARAARRGRSPCRRRRS